MAKGRPRGFDADEMLDRVVNVFWQHGYEGASMATLMAATGLNKPSLYAAFGSKEELFLAAFERYWQRQGELTRKHLDEPDARTGVERMLLALVDIQTQPGLPHGCLAVHGGLVGSAASAAIRDELRLRQAALQTMVQNRLTRAQAEGELAASVDVADLARYFTIVGQGAAVQAAGGASREELHRVVAVAMRAWPAGN
ncbi:MAG: TetR family transcriptional regulator [Comamonadaceae bacterium]|nr:MAG: TetR family transcriptional regulator [Comamonadaceae bacterium]